MGKRGPKPTSSKVLQMRGSYRGNAGEAMTVRASRPHIPAEVKRDHHAEAAWVRLVRHLHAAGVLTAIDRDALADYCLIRAELKRTYGALAKLRELYGADPVRLARESESLQRLVLALRRECRPTETAFGMNPSDRGRVVMPERPAAKTPEAEAAKDYFGAGQ